MGGCEDQSSCLLSADIIVVHTESPLPLSLPSPGIRYTRSARRPNPMLQMAELSCLPGRSLPCGQSSGSCPCKKDMTLSWTRAESPGKIMQERFHVGPAVSWVLFYALVLPLAIQG